MANAPIARVWLALVGLSACATRPAPFVDRIVARLPPPGSAVRVDDGGRDAQAMALVGREDRVAQMAPKPTECRPLLRDGAEVAPLAEIVRRARDAQVVIINEAHDHPEGRAFIADVAVALAPLGFTVYAAEAFSTSIGRNGPRYPLASDGTYVNEPTFGDLLRHVRALGYALTPYEHILPPGTRPTGSEAEMSARELGQVDNLVARIFAAQPRARVLIHVGYSHARELPEDGLGWMALRFKEKTGIDPLTVDQTTFGPFGDRYRTCASNLDGSALDPAFDLQVMPPAPRFARGRPTWRLERGQRAVDVPAALRRPGERMLVEAYRADEPDQAVPADRILIDPGEDLPLLLPSGRYRVRARTVNGRWSPPTMLELR
jgi:hypothetical protein